MAKINRIARRNPEFHRNRELVMARDHRQCQAQRLGLIDEPCGETRECFLTIHHILELAWGGTHDVDNMIVLCEKHHVYLHQLPVGWDWNFDDGGESAVS